MDGQIVIGTKIDTKSFESQIDALEDKLDTLTKEYSVAMKDADFPEEEILKYRKEIEQTTNKLIKLKKQQDDLGKTGLQNVGKSMSSIISKVTKWGLAVFGVRSAYMFVRQAMSTLSQYDDQMATDLEYMSWVIANTLKPVIEWIIEATYKVLGAFGALIKAISGVNIFANSSAKAFEKIKKNAKATSKATKEIKKDLYGWDEATRIEESSGLAGGIGSTKTPNIDIEKETENAFEKAKNAANGTMEAIKGLFSNGWKIILKNWWKDMKLTFKPFNEKILQPYLIKPLKEGLKIPTSLLNEYVITPLKSAFKTAGDILYDIFVKPVTKATANLDNIIRGFINGIIDDINGALSVLGIQLPRLSQKIKNETNVTEKTVTGALKSIKTDADNLTNKEYKLDIKSSSLSNITKGLSGTLSSLKNLTSKTWNIKTSWAAQAASGAVQGLKNLIINLPKMAKGGIINNPGKGVPVGGAIAGERGKEGVIPLTDSQQMEMIGEAIGKYVTINLTNTIKMNARQIAKETKRVSAENDFATNS